MSGLLAKLREPGTWPWLATAIPCGLMGLWASGWPAWEQVAAGVAIVTAGALAGAAIDALVRHRRRA